MDKADDTCPREPVLGCDPGQGHPREAIPDQCHMINVEGYTANSTAVEPGTSDTMTTMARPNGPSVSMASRCDRNWTPSSFSSSSTCKKCLVLRARRSQAQTTTTSNLRLCASLSSLSSAGRRLHLTGDEIKQLDEVSALPPEYPGWMLPFQSASR